MGYVGRSVATPKRALFSKMATLSDCEDEGGAHGIPATKHQDGRVREGEGEGDQIDVIVGDEAGARESLNIFRFISKVELENNGDPERNATNT